MKVIRVANFDNDTVGDELIMDNLCDSAARALVDRLNSNCNSRSPFWHMAVPDEHKLYSN